MRRRNLLTSLAAASMASMAIPAASNSRKPQTRRPFVEARDGTNLFVRDWGQGKPLVFAAPWALNSDYWEYQMTPLSARGLRCVAYDRRGHGRSDEPAHGYDLDSLADDLAAVMDQADLRDVTLIGHSMGAAEVVRYLTRHGTRRVARLALIAPVTPALLCSQTLIAQFRWNPNFTWSAIHGSKPLDMRSAPPPNRIVPPGLGAIAVFFHRSWARVGIRDP